MIYLLVGRSGVGKDTLAAELEKRGLTRVISYTDRPKRTPNEDTHIFISPEEYEAIPDKVATTVINNYHYFATRKQVEKAGCYTIDPNGIKELTENMPDTDFVIVYITADPELQKRYAVLRATDPVAEEEVFARRILAENDQFLRFEEQLHNGDLVHDNVIETIEWENDYTFLSMAKFASELYRKANAYN